MECAASQIENVAVLLQMILQLGRQPVDPHLAVLLLFDEAGFTQCPEMF